MRVRLYWSLARLAAAEGRGAVALTNIRKAIALLETTEDALNLARAHVLAAKIELDRSDAQPAAEHLDQAERLFGVPANQDLVEMKILRSRIAAARGDADTAVELAREAIAVDSSKADRGLALSRSRRRPGAPRRHRRRRRRVPRSGRHARGGRLVAARRERLPRLGEHAPRERTRARGARRARPRSRPRHARDAAGTPPSVDLRARGHAARPVLARTLGTHGERRDAHVPRRAAHAGARRRRPRGARAGVAVAGRRRHHPRRVGGGGRTRALAARPRRRPLRVPRPRAERPPARPRVARAARAAPRPRADGRARAAARVLRPAHRGEARTPPRADDRAGALRSGSGEPARLADRRRPRRARAGAAPHAWACTRAAPRRSCGSAGRSSSSACTARRRRRSCAGSNANAVSGRGRSASSASKGSAASTTASSATSASSSSCAPLRGRPVEGWETAELLAPYGEWSGLASVYLLAGFARGLLSFDSAAAA